jgi:16S rRNA (guanine1207-N2)-methyltransferase
MNHKNPDSKHQHYSSPLPDVNLRFFTVPVSVRRHLYLCKTVNGIFSFKKLDLGTKILIDHIYIPPNDPILLDLGCGYGIIGIVLLYERPESKVYFIDSNKLAVWCSRENVKFNVPHKIKDAFMFNGNYFEPLAGKEIKFDAIYMNPPMRKGRKEFINLFKVIPQFLKPGGTFQFVIMKKLGAQYVFDYLNNTLQEGGISIVCKRSGYWVFCFHYEST